MKQAEMTRLMEEKWGIKYGQSTVCRLIRLWKIPHRVSNRMYENSRLYVARESVGRVDMEGRGRGELVDRLGIGAVRKRILGEESDVQIGEENSHLEESLDGSESLQGLQSLGTAAMLEQEKESMSIMARSTGDTNSVLGSSQYELAPLLEHNRILERTNQSLDAITQAVEPTLQAQLQNRYQTIHQQSLTHWQYQMN